MATKAQGFSNPKQEKPREISFADETADFGAKSLVLSYNKEVCRFDLRLDGDLVFSDCALAEVRQRFEDMKKNAPPRPKEPEKETPEAGKEVPGEEPPAKESQSPS